MLSHFCELANRNFAKPLHLKICRYSAVKQSGRTLFAPTDIGDSLLCRKIATLFADFTLYKDIVKAVQSFVLRHRFVLITTLYFFFTFSAPLGRLTPIEALPQAPQGTLSLDPASPLTPGLSLRFISRYARC